jgi:hypothetical protein
MLGRSGLKGLHSGVCAGCLCARWLRLLRLGLRVSGVGGQCPPVSSNNQSRLSRLATGQCAYGLRGSSTGTRLLGVAWTYWSI